MSPNHDQEEGHLLGCSNIIGLEAKLHALKVCCDALVVGSVLLKLYNTFRVVGYISTTLTIHARL